MLTVPGTDYTGIIQHDTGLQGRLFIFSLKLKLYWIGVLIV
jgi:hypothetical protein